MCNECADRVKPVCQLCATGCTPLAHRLHTIGTPVAHHWHTIGTPVAHRLAALSAWMSLRTSLECASGSKSRAARLRARGFGCERFCRWLVAVIGFVTCAGASNHCDCGSPFAYQCAPLGPVAGASRSLLSGSLSRDVITATVTGHDLLVDCTSAVHLGSRTSVPEMLLAARLRAIARKAPAVAKLLRGI